ncbi:hypothetical protein Fcan01_25056 [Folsomia candida]|uniref:Uncharacterized protein n=1 Tax=Folsomia candida TaxID=158441 RepID=A0A226D5R9_FOLCA|nr:hypothetical protein Fcan01_25056 [Folsomia candida]
MVSIQRGEVTYRHRAVLMARINTARSNPIKENILSQPIDPIFSSLHAGPTCLIYVIIVKPELSDEYDTVVWYSSKHSRSPTLHTHWNKKGRNRYFSYFYAGMIAIFGNTSAIGTIKRALTQAVFRQPIILFFQISCAKSKYNSYFIEPNVTLLCQDVKLAENIDLYRIIGECKKLVRPDKLRVGFNWKRQDFFKSFTGMKTYSMQDSMNGVLTHMLTQETNASDGSHQIKISHNVDMTMPFSLVTDSDMASISFILVGNWSFSFVTCSSLSHGRVDYSGYVRPLDVSVWYSLTCCCLMITILLIGQNYNKFLALIWPKIAYTICNALLDIGFLTTGRSSSTLQIMFQSPASEKLIILWALMTFVVVNIYTSIVTEDTTAPLVSDPPRMFDNVTLYMLWVRSLPPDLRGVVEILRKHRLCAARKSVVKMKDIPSSSCNGLNWTSFYKANHNLLTQAEQEFKNTELGRMAGRLECLSDF